MQSEIKNKTIISKIDNSKNNKGKKENKKEKEKGERKIKDKKENKKEKEKGEKGNKGEKGEVQVKKKIYNLSQINDINSLKLIFGDDAEQGIIMYDSDTNNKIENVNDIKKAKNKSKADFMIKFIKNNEYMYCSIKCEHGAMPAILNHTPRSANVFQAGGDLFAELDNLDILISFLNKERTIGNIKEDIHLKNMNISEEYKKCIINVITYFLFYGTGCGKSKYPSNSILEIKEPNNIKQWKFYNCINNEKKIEYVKNIYDRIILSMRDKGMPSKKNALCDLWILYQTKKNIIKEKGSLHIRLKKQSQ
jgi:hypothetical protein